MRFFSTSVVEKALAVWLLGCLLAPAASAATCNQVDVITDTGGTLTDLSDRPGTICSVEFIANAANGWAAVWDTPDDTVTHDLAVPKSEPGAAVAFDSDARDYGPDGRPTRFGIDVEVVNGTLIVQWAGAAR